MNIFRFLYPKNSLKRKILFVKDDMKKIVFEVSTEDVRIDWYRAYDIDPKHLVFCKDR